MSLKTAPVTPRLTALVSASLAALTLLAASASSASADVKPAELFSDHMVLLSGSRVPIWGWASPAEKVTVAMNGQTQTATADSTGKWTVALTDLKPGGPYTMTVAGASNTVTVNDVEVGEVWLASGQSNMDFTVSNNPKTFAGVQNMDTEIAAANYPQIRMFTVDLKLTDTPQDDVAGHWAVCSPDTVGQMSAVAYFFARELNQDRKVPVGIIDSTWAASTAQCWTSRDTLVADPLLKPFVDAYETYVATWTTASAQATYQVSLAKWQTDDSAAKAAGTREPRKPGAPKDPHQDQHNPYLLYNGMIAPVAPYAIRGVIWYQGESNGPSADIYYDLMQKLIANWRSDWGEGNFPFLQVQLAGYGKSTDSPIQGRSQTATIRQAQLDVAKWVPNAYMATAVDIGDHGTIHPKNKQEVGRRLGLIARSQVYNEPGLVYSGPLYDSMSVTGNTATIKFTQLGGGLATQGDKLDGFAVTGDGKTWFAGDAQIAGDTVAVSSASVPTPTAVRYDWSDYPPTTLYNKAGLPASPFATDIVEQGK